MTARYDQRPKLGVEEEFFVVTPGEGTVEPAGSRVLRAAEPVLGELISGEFTEYQVEVKTPPCTRLNELCQQLGRVRGAVTEAADREGLRIVASGTPVLGAREPAPVRDSQYYRACLDRFRALNDNYTLCALHTHVEVPAREEAVLVSNHLRPWLPTLVAMAANSPFWGERDSGYASWRTIAVSRWPVAGPPPYFSSLEHYEELSGELQQMGAALSERTLLWDVRPSAHLPTLEVRAMDVTASVEEAAVFAALTRALVVTALERVRRGDPGPLVCDSKLRAAYWRAARDGWSGQGLDLESQRLMPTRQLVRRLVDHVRPVLAEFEELEQVIAVLRRLAARSGAERQRIAFGRRESLRDVVDHLIEHTAYVPSDDQPVTVPA